MTDDISQYNKDELNPPEWINKEFFTKIFSRHEGFSTDIEKYEISPGTGKGDHYGSVIFRAKVNYTITADNECTQKYQSVIIKTMPYQEGAKKELISEFSLFETEIMMYSEILPEMEQLLKAVGDETKLCAKMLYSSLTPHQCIVFEDLVEKGFTVVRKRFCSLDEVNTAYAKLARLHAVSYKLLQEGDTKMKELKSIFTKEAIENFEFIKNGVKNFKRFISKEDDLKKYVPYVEKVENNILDNFVAVFDPEEIRKRGGILVLNHGDFHMKNLMSKYDQNEFKDVMLVDYQISHYGSSVIDLLFGSVLMFSPEMRLNHRDEIFSKYFETFQETLKILGFAGKIPNRTDFYEELRKYKRYELFLMMSFRLFIYVFIDDNTLSDVLENVELRENLWRDERILSEIRLQLSLLEEQNYFN